MVSLLIVTAFYSFRVSRSSIWREEVMPGVLGYRSCFSRVHVRSKEQGSWQADSGAVLIRRERQVSQASAGSVDMKEMEKPTGA